MTTSALPIPPTIQRRPLRADEFMHLAESGYFGVEDRLELIEGEILVMSPIGDLHGAVVRWLDRIFNDPLLRHRAGIQIQSSISLSEYSQPQPDACLITIEAFRRPSHPTPADIHLIIEVSDSTLEYDRGVKLSLYARAGIAECWIVNLQDNVLEVYRVPDKESATYRQTRSLAKGEAIAPMAFPDFEVPVSEVLP